MIDIRPEQPLDLAALADRREERAVAEDRRWPERIPAPRAVECRRHVLLYGHQRGLDGEHRRRGRRAVARANDGDERDALALSVAPRIEVDARTAPSRRCRVASSSPRLHAVSQTSRRAGRAWTAVAETRSSELISSGATRTVALAAPRSGRSALARSRSADSAGTVERDAAVRSARAGATPPRRGSQEADGVEVWTVTRADSSPALKTARYSRRASRSIRLTARRLCCATRTIEPPVDSAGCAPRSAPSTRRCSATGCGDDVEGRPGSDRRRRRPAPPSATRRPASGTCPGARPCRRRGPIIPTSSP